MELFNRPTLTFLAALMVGCGPGLEGEDARAEVVEEASAPLTTPVPDLIGLSGTYLRVGFVPLGQMSRVVLTPGATPSAGHYTRTLNKFCFPAPSCARESGAYDAIPENPAIGFAALILGTGPTRSLYIIDGITRDALRRITTVQLRLLTGNTVGAPFLMRRFP